MTEHKKTRRRRGERSDGLIQVTLSVGHQANGKPRRISFYGKTRAEAQQKRDEYKRLMETGRADGKPITVSEWVDNCVSLYRNNINPLYRDMDAAHFRKIKDALGDRYVSSIRQSDLQKFLNDMKGLSAPTLAKYKGAVCLVFRYAKLNGYIAYNPAQDLQVPQGTCGTHRCLTQDEMYTVITYWDKHPIGLAAVIMLLCGMRRGQTIALQWESVDLESRTISVHQVAAGYDSVIQQRAKSKAGIRSVPICQTLYDILSSFPQEKRNGFVVLNQHGERYTIHVFDSAWKYYCRYMECCRNGLPIPSRDTARYLDDARSVAQREGREYHPFHIRTHDLRHSYATLLYESGTDIKVAQKLVGHAKSKTTIDLYTHLREQHLTRAMRQSANSIDSIMSAIGKSHD